MSSKKHYVKFCQMIEEIRYTKTLRITSDRVDQIKEVIRRGHHTTTDIIYCDRLIQVRIGKRMKTARITSNTKTNY